MIIALGIISPFLLIGLILLIKRKIRDRELKKWQVGDLIKMKFSLRERHLGESSSRSAPIIYVKLVAWNRKEVIVDLPDPKNHLCIPHSDVELNHSRNWRKKYEKAKRLMGKKEWEKSKKYEEMKKVKSQAVDILGLGSIDENNYTID